MHPIDVCILTNSLMWRMHSLPVMGFSQSEPEADRWLDRYFELIDRACLPLALPAWAPVLYRSAQKEGRTSSVLMLDGFRRSDTRWIPRPISDESTCNPVLYCNEKCAQRELMKCVHVTINSEYIITMREDQFVCYIMLATVRFTRPKAWEDELNERYTMLTIRFTQL